MSVVYWSILPPLYSRVVLMLHWDPLLYKRWGHDTSVPGSGFLTQWSYWQWSCGLKIHVQPVHFMGCQTWPLQAQLAERSLTFRHSVDVLSCGLVVGYLEEDLCGRTRCKWRTHRGPVATEEPWLNMDRRTLAVSQSHGNATADYPLFPPPPPFQIPSLVASHIHTRRLSSQAEKHLSFCLHSCRW